MSPAFKALVPALAEVGIHLAVATHSDREENLVAARSGAVGRLVSSLFSVKVSGFSVGRFRFSVDIFNDSVWGLHSEFLGSGAIC